MDNNGTKRDAPAVVVVTRAGRVKGVYTDFVAAFDDLTEGAEDSEWHNVRNAFQRELYVYKSGRRIRYVLRVHEVVGEA